MSPHDTEYVERFFSTIDPWVDAYANIGFSFFAVRKDGVNYLLQARLFLNTTAPTVQQFQVETASILAGNFNFSELGLNLRDFVNIIIGEGCITTPVGKLTFPTEDKRELSANFDPFHQEGVSGGSRLSVLTITGARKYPYIELPKMDWELKAALKPFDSVDELLTLLVLGGKRADASSLEIVAYSVAAVDLSSKVGDGEASPSIFLAKSLDPNKCMIGYRIYLHGNVESRGSILGSELTWTEQEKALHGVGRLGIPQGAVLHCVASYNGYAQHQGWIADPKNSQNSRRVLLEEFHNGLDILQSLLYDEQRRGKDARDFEFGVAWLAWMLGFSTSQIGGRERTSDAADMVATTPSGNILIVECTTGLLKSDKVAKLVERTEIIRKRLVTSGNQHLKVVPVIATSKPRDEVKADLEEVKNKGVAVLTKEDLEDMLSQTIVLPDAEAIFDRAWRATLAKDNQPAYFRP